MALSQAAVNPVRSPLSRYASDAVGADTGYSSNGVLVELSDGSQMTVYRRGQGHPTVGDSGDVVVERTLDGGWSWSGPKTILTETDIDHVTSCAGGTTSTGRVIVFYTRYDTVADVRLNSKYVYTDDPTAAIPTWSAPQTLSLELTDVIAWNVHGPMVQVGSTLIQTWFGREDANGPYFVKLLKSTDNGATWGASITMVESTVRAYGEVSVASLGGNTLVALVRDYIVGTADFSGRFTQFLSTDLGATWTNQGLWEIDSWEMDSPPMLVPYTVDGVLYVACYYANRVNNTDDDLDPDPANRRLRGVYALADDLLVGPSGWQADSRTDIGDSIVYNAAGTAYTTWDYGYPAVVARGVHHNGWYYSRGHLKFFDVIAPGGAELGQYFDGDTPGYAWSDTNEGSTSYFGQPFQLEPLDLHVQLVKPDGHTFIFDGDMPTEWIPENIQFASGRNTGFTTASFRLRTRLDIDHPALALLDEIKIVSSSGFVAYEGFISSLPRDLGTDGHTIEVHAVGYMAHMQDRKVPLLYVDRDLGAWEGPSTQRQIELVDTFTQKPVAHEISSDQTVPSLLTQLSDAWLVAVSDPSAEGWYYSGGLPIGLIRYAWQKGATVNSADVNWIWRVFLVDRDHITGAASVNTGNLRAAGPGSGTLTADDVYTYAQIQLAYPADGGAAGAVYPVWWSGIGVYGDHGLTKRGDAPEGFYASDILRHMVATHCPLLNTDGVEDTSWIVPHFAYRAPTTPYDAALALNAYHLKELAVWEDKTVYWTTLDLTDWDWEVRQDDPGVTISLQGDASDDLVNGVIVSYYDLDTRRQETLYPDDDDRLRDDTESNPYTAHGRSHDLEVTLTNPNQRDSAIELGRVALAEALQAKRPGTITVSGGYLRDRQGNLQPAWKARATDRIRITDIPADLPRPIGECAWSHGSKTLTVGVESSIQTLQAFHDRVSVSTQAAGLGV